MNRRFLPVAVLTLSALSACTTRVIEVQPIPPSEASSGTLEAATTAPRNTVPAVPAGSTRERYLQAVYDMHPYPIYAPDDLLWDLGVSVCDGLSSGTTVDQLAEIFVRSADGDQQTLELFATISAGAITYICPEFSYIFDQIDSY